MQACRLGCAVYAMNYILHYATTAKAIDGWHGLRPVHQRATTQSNAEKCFMRNRQHRSIGHKYSCPIAVGTQVVRCTLLRLAEAACLGVTDALHLFCYHHRCSQVQGSFAVSGSSRARCLVRYIPQNFKNYKHDKCSFHSVRLLTTQVKGRMMKVLLICFIFIHFQAIISF